jgi:hypothetical protein
MAIEHENKKWRGLKLEGDGTGLSNINASVGNAWRKVYTSTEELLGISGSRNIRAISACCLTQAQTPRTSIKELGQTKTQGGR